MQSQLNSKVDVEYRRNLTDFAWTYSALDLRQKEIAQRVRQGGLGALLVSEVAPVVTYGRRTPQGDLTKEENFFKLGISTYPADRGGFATYHGPGQWVLFPVDSMERLVGSRIGVKRVIEGLLESALQVGRKYEPKAEIRKGCELGVWTPRGKFAAVGIHVQQGVLQHGLAVNGFKTPQSFQGLRPCGLDAPIDFLLWGADESEFIQLRNALVASILQNLWVV